MYFPQLDAWVTIEQEDTIVHPCTPGQFLHDAASHCIIHDGRSNMFHLGMFGHFDFWKQYAEPVGHSRDVSASETHIGYLGPPLGLLRFLSASTQ